MKKTLIVSALAVVGLATAIGGWFTFWPSSSSYAAGTLYRQVGMDGGDRHFRHHRGRHGHRAVARLCSDRRDRSIEAVTGFVEGFVNLTDEQKGPWQALSQSVTESSAMIGKTCEEVNWQDRSQPTPQKLEQIEKVLTTGLSIIQKVRPAYNDFYAVLTDAQKKALDGLIARRHGRSHR